MLNLISLRSVSKLFSIVYIVYGLQSPALAQNTCNDLFVKPVYGSVREDFKFNTSYTKEIANIGEIKNQCSLGTCHLYAWTSKLESDYKLKTNKEIKISADYLSVKHWLQNSLNLLEKGFLTSKPKLGGTTAFSRKLLIQYGVIPESVWKPRAGFALAGNVKMLEQYLKNILNHAKLEMKFHKKNEEKKLEVMVQAEAQIKDLFNNMVGLPPEKFIYEGQTYTPQGFQQRFFHELSNPLTVLEAAHERKKSESVMRQGDKTVTIIKDVSLENIERKIVELIDKNQPVTLSYYHDSAFIDKDTGNMSFRALFLPPNGAPLSRANRNAKGLNEGGHAVIIVGYDLDPKTGRVIKYKIQNSWGQKSGTEGFYHMYADYFRAFVNRIHYYD